MSDIVICVDNLSKRYRIGQVSGRHSGDGLRHILHDAATRPFRAIREKWRRGEEEREIGTASASQGLNTSDTRNDFWALKDVSFEVKRGDVIGITGRNGAGKSTLLKILSRITEPTGGRIGIKGRVASLLEVGTGFHQELTGRENIYLNGAILGMSRAEVHQKFDEIVAFSEVETFLDTPVKRYSSGMYVRLAFAVAAHLEPEILIIDEVLAVGDIAFQRKCLGKMNQVSKEGRTVLFVSHNMAAVQALCSKGLFLTDGRIVSSGDIRKVLGTYMGSSSGQIMEHSVVLGNRSGRRDIWMESVHVICNGSYSSQIAMGDEISFEVKFRSAKPIQKPIVGYLIRSARGENAVNANNDFLDSSSFTTPVTEGSIICKLGALPLMAGSYSVSFWLCRNPHDQHHVEDALSFEVSERDVWGNGKLPTRSLSCLWWDTEFEFASA